MSGTDQTFGKSFVLLVGKEAEGRRKLSLEKRLGWFGGRTVLLKGSPVSEHPPVIRGLRRETLPQSWVVGWCRSGKKELPSLH